jgi:DUF438 domain-containing protein
MATGLGNTSKKDILREIILQLHKGLSLEQARDRFLKEVGNVSSVEIAQIEQSLIDEGLSPEEIKKFCNVHALLFESSLKQAVAQEQSPAHPVYLFKLENREIEKRLAALRKAAGEAAADPGKRPALIEGLRELSGLEAHYTRKEQVLFPYLEKHGFQGPSKVMWGKDDEVRTLLRQARHEAERGAGTVSVGFVRDRLEPLLAEVEGMIFKEENILFPTALEKLTVEEWAAVLKESEEVGYAFIRKPKETAALADELLKAVTDAPAVAGAPADGPAGEAGQGVRLPSGALTLPELLGVLNTLPVDITFIDAEDTVKYFSEGKDRIFVRTRSIIGRKVQNCHPPHSVAAVERILASFKDGSRDVAEFWIRFQGRFVHIRYFAVREAVRQNVGGAERGAIRDAERRYLGTLEVSQDIGPIRALEGEKRLLDDQA